MVYSNQQAYYDAITSSNVSGESTPFIEFMLAEILAALTRGEGEGTANDIEYVPIKVLGTFPNKIPNIFPNKFRIKYPQLPDAVWHIASLINHTPGASAEKVGEALGISGRMVRIHISTLRKMGILERVGSNKTGYWKLNRIDPTT